jgi:hypothetical protein
MLSREDNVWVAQRGYTPLTGCEIKGDVVIIAQWGSGGAPPRPSVSNRLLTEAGDSFLQEDGSFLLLDGYN